LCITVVHINTSYKAPDTSYIIITVELNCLKYAGSYEGGYRHTAAKIACVF